MIHFPLNSDCHLTQRKHLGIHQLQSPIRFVTPVPSSRSVLVITLVNQPSPHFSHQGIYLFVPGDFQLHCNRKLEKDRERLDI